MGTGSQHSGGLRPGGTPAKARKWPVGTNYKPMNRADVAAFIPPSTCICIQAFHKRTGTVRRRSID